MNDWIYRDDKKFKSYSENWWIETINIVTIW